MDIIENLLETFEISNIVLLEAVNKSPFTFVKIKFSDLKIF